MLHRKLPYLDEMDGEADLTQLMHQVHLHYVHRAQSAICITSGFILFDVLNFPQCNLLFVIFSTSKCAGILSFLYPV